MWTPGGCPYRCRLCAYQPKATAFETTLAQTFTESLQIGNKVNIHRYYTKGSGGKARHANSVHSRADAIETCLLPPFGAWGELSGGCSSPLLFVR